MTALTNWFQGIDLNRIIEWLMFAAAALFAICVHESCHALSALWLGDDTAKRMGRISLNPLRHLDPVGFLMMVVAHFGWAKPVPINPYRMTKVKNPKVGMALTAAAGPISNVILAFLFGIGYFIVLYPIYWPYWLEWGYYISASGWRDYLGLFLFRCFLLNAGLAVFNLIPVSPLDGSKIFAIVLPNKAYAWLMRYEKYGFIILAVLLFTGVLDKPLSYLVGGLMYVVAAVAEPIARLITGV